MKNSTNKSIKTKQQLNNISLTKSQVYKRLSCRESEVLERIAEGKTTRKIADELFLSPKTVENHITNIGKKLGLSGRGRMRSWLEQRFNQ